MAYEPKEWVCGETITADGLNNLEEGIQEALDCCGGGAMIVGVSEEICEGDQVRMVLDKTWNEIKTAYDNGLPIYAYLEILGGGGTEYRRIPLSSIYQASEPSDYAYGVEFEDERLFSDSADGVLRSECQEK